jgi:tetratricopeptide (TPR) repeat protein
MLLSFFCLSAVVGVFALASAWTRTVQREAYLPDLETQARRTPHDAVLLTLLGGRLAEADEYAAAEQTLEKAVGDGAQDASVWLTWAASNAALGRPLKAGAVLRLGRRQPGVAPAIQAAIDRCRPLGATPSPAALAQAICPDGAKPLIQGCTSGSFLNPLAEFWGRRHPLQSGFATRQQWVREKPSDIPVRLLWVDALTRNRRLREAEQEAQQAVRMAPASPDTHLALGNVLFKGGAAVKAGLQYKQCLRLRPDYLPAEIGLGQVAVEKKLIPMAVELFERATKQSPDSTDAWVGLGRAYLNQRMRYDKSLAAFQKAARLSPGRTDYFPYYSDTLILTYHPEQAEALLRRRLRDDGTDARSYYLLALILLNNGPTPARQAEAETDLRTSLRLEPNAVSAKVRLAQVLLDQSQYQEAERLLLSSMQDDPYSPLAASLLARACLGSGQPEKAKIAQERSVQLSAYTQAIAELQAKEDADPLDPSLHERLAFLYRRGDQQEQAEREAQMAYLLRTHKKAASQGLTDLNSATGAYAPVPNRLGPSQASPSENPH